MIGSIISKIFGNKSAKDIKRLLPVVAEINKEYDTLNSLSDQEIIDKYQSLRDALRKDIELTKKALIEKNEDAESIDEKLNQLENDFLNKNLNSVFAIVKDVSRRLCGKEIIVMNQKMEWNMIHYDEQIIGGMVLHEGKVAEMKTGEGKTLVSTLPIVLNALTGR